MNFESMSLTELKALAKEKHINANGVNKTKLIEKLKSIETANSVMTDDDLTEIIPAPVNEVPTTNKNESTLKSILSAIDDIEEADSIYKVDSIPDMPQDKVIPVRSIRKGILIYKNPVNNVMVVWNHIGDVQHMTIKEITEMNNYSTTYLTKPYIILDDEDAIKHFRLTKIYENVAKVNNLKDLFKRDLDTIAKTIDDAIAVNMRDILISKISTMYEKKILTDIRVIKLLSDKLKYDFAQEIN